MKKNNLTKNTILLSIGTMLNKGITFVMIPFFSRWLSTAEYGTFDLFCTYVTMLIPLLSMSTADAVFRFGIEETTKEKKSEHITNGFCILLVGILLITAGSIGIAVGTHWEHLVPFSLMLLSELINKYLQSFLRAIKKLNIYSFCSAFSTIFTFAGVTLFVKVYQMGLNGIIYGYAFGFLAGNMAIIIWTKWWTYLTKTYSVAGIRKLIKYSLPLIPNSVSWWIINVSDRSIINVFLGAASNGIYAIACKVPNLCTSIFSVFSISWQEAASEMVDDAERNQYFDQVYNKMYVTLLSLCWGILSCNFILFQWLFDHRYFEGHLYTPLLVTSVLFGSLSLFFGGIQISFKNTKANGMTTVVGAVVNVIIHLLLVSWIGLHAAVISTLAANMTVLFLRQFLLRKQVRLKILKKNWIYTIFYLYIMVCAYFVLPISWNIMNLFLACVMFAVVNKDFVEKFVKKITRK